MDRIVEIGKLYHRSKSRIKTLGEVFTPENYVEDMLDLIAKGKKGIWADEHVTFFEPCAGHGNIALAIYRRRLEAFYKKATLHGVPDAAYYAVANSLNTLWAIDIDYKNVENCRSRIMSATLSFLKIKLHLASDIKVLANRQSFFAHIISAIKWHIDVNETLSALSNCDSARSNANLTKTGSRWFAQNGHNPIDFQQTWVNFFQECETTKTVPLEYERATRFVENAVLGKIKGFDEYQFVKAVLNINKPLQKIDESRDSFLVSF